MPQAALCHRSDLAARLREKAPGLPVILLCHRTPEVLERFPSMETDAPYARTFLWTGNSNLLLAVIKSLEDRIDWIWITALHRTDETPFVVHAETGQPITLKVDGRKTLGVLLET